MCSTCSSGGAFDCEDFSAGFYLVIIGSILAVAGIVIFVVFKLRKKKEKSDSVFSEEKSKLTDQLTKGKGNKKSRSEEY